MDHKQRSARLAGVGRASGPAGSDGEGRGGASDLTSRTSLHGPSPKKREKRGDGDGDKDKALDGEAARARPRPSPDAVGARVSPKIREQYARSPSLSVGMKEAQRKRGVIAEQETQAQRADKKASHDQMRRLGLEEAQRNRFLLTGGAQEHVIEKMFKQRLGARPCPAGPSHGNQSSPFHPIQETDEQNQHDPGADSAPSPSIRERKSGLHFVTTTILPDKEPSSKPSDGRTASGTLRNEVKETKSPLTMTIHLPPASKETRAQSIAAG